MKSRVVWCRQAFGSSIRFICTSLLVLLFIAFYATTSFAQSRMAGVVKDTSGAVLPGVTVEASSPVLIEKTRTVTTDGQGAYEIIDLRPGVYSMTFTLSGFATVRHDGIDLPASFTATVNAELKVGEVAETLTVTGQAPLVDTREAARSQTVGQTELQALPMLNRDPSGYIATIPGVTGINLGGLGFTQKTTAIHGGNGAETFTSIDGFTTQESAAVGGGGTNYYITQAYVQEVAITTDAGDAEQRMSGIVSNVIPKEGGNRYSGYFFTGDTASGMVANNVDSALQAKGFSQAGLKESWDVSPAGGGPIVKDKLWFFNSWRSSGIEQYIPNLYVNTTPQGWAYTPDLTRPAWVEQKDSSGGIRLTWQASPRNKFSAFTDWQPHTYYNRNYGSLTSLEATTYSPAEPNQFTTAVWKSPVSNKLLLEAGVSYYDTIYTPQRDLDGTHGGLRNTMPPQDYVTVAKLESSTGMNFGSPNPGAATAWGTNKYPQTNVKASASYVTGSNTVKFGFTDLWGFSYIDTNTNGPYSATLLNGKPNALTEWEQPNGRTSNTKADIGVFVKDDFTRKRLTLNLGLRFDYFNAYVPAQTLQAGYFEGSRQFAGIDDVIVYKDISPRIGAAYDLFGDGRTAIKAFIGRFVVGLGANQVNPYNPVTTSVLSASRQWNDANGDFLPTCDLTNPLLNGECGQINNLAFGQANPNATVTNPALTHGWGNRDFYWNSSVQLERQIRDGISVSVGYFRSSLTAHSAVAGCGTPCASVSAQNLLTKPTDYDPYCITAPLNPGLPGGGGYSLCGLYDVTQSLFGKTQNYNTFSSDFGFQPTQVYNGVDLTTNVRLPGGARLSGGMSDGRTENNSCFVMNSPQSLLFCDTKPPFQPNFRFRGSVPIRWGVDVAVVFSNVPGAAVTATYSASNAQIAPSLGRTISEGSTALISVPLIQPGTLFGSRQNQIDLRVAKSFHFLRGRYTASMDVQNLFNESAVQTYNTTYGTTGATWLTPTQIQNPRYARINLEVNF
jgi:hypothetical protein